MTSRSMDLDTTLKATTIDRLRQFIRIDSRSSADGGVEGELQRVIAGEMERLGADVRMFQPREVAGFFEHPLCCGPGRNFRDRPTVVGSLGAASGPTLMVMAHADTVPLFEPDKWTVDPFGGVMDGSRVYGLGASDDKWGLAAILMLIESLRGHPALSRKRLLFVNTVDEENGVGNGMLLLHLAGVRADAALYLDGHLMEIDAGNLGGSNLYLRPIESIDEATMGSHHARLAAAVEAMSLRREPLFDHGLFRENHMRRSSVLIHRRRDASGPFFLIAFYTLPGEAPEPFCAELERVVRDALGDESNRYQRGYRTPWFEPATVPIDTPILGHITAAATDVLGHSPRVSTMSKNDGFVLINHARIPTVAFGVTARSTGRGAYHQADEYVTTDELWTGCRVAHETVRRWLDE